MLWAKFPRTSLVDSGMSFALRTLVHVQHHPWRHLVIVTTLFTVAALGALMLAAVGGVQSSVRPSAIQIDPIERAVPITDPTSRVAL